MGTSMTAMLVGTPEDVGGHPGVTATIPRDEIEEALASDQPLDLILDVTWPRDGGVETTDVTVTWQRSDLESLLAGMDSDAITLSFDRAGLQRAIDEPDFEGQGIREVMLLTVAAASASAAMAVSTAQGQLMDAGGGGGPAPVVVAPGHGEAGTASALAPSGLDVPIATAIAAHEEVTAASGLDVSIATAIAAHDAATGPLAAPGHDEATLAARGVDVPIATAIAAAGAGEATTARDLAAPAIHDETSLAARGVGQAVPGMDEATLAARGIETVAPGGRDEATFAARGIDAGTPAATHDEATLAARGVGVTVPGMDETTLAARGIEPQSLPASHDEATLAARGVEGPVVADSGSSFELPSVDSGAAAAIGGFAGAGLLIAAAAFAARRNRVGTT